MKTIIKIGISAISAAAVAGVGYLGKKTYDKKKSMSVENKDNTTNETTVETSAEMSTNNAE